MSTMNNGLNWICWGNKNSPALITPDRVYTYAELRDRIDSAARTIEACGIRADHRILVPLGKRFSDLIILLACLRTGAVPCVVHPKTPNVVKQRMMRFAGCSGELIMREVDFGSFSLDFARTKEDIVPADIAEASVVVYTSGSTGDPKAALLTIRALCHNAKLSNANIPVSSLDRWAMTVPLCHVSGLGIMFRCLMNGAAVVFERDATCILDTLSTHRVTHVSFVPTQLHRMMHSRTFHSGKRNLMLKCVLLGGAPLPEPLVRKAFAAGLPINMTYGLTEMASQVTTTKPEDAYESIGTCGVPLESGSVSITSEQEIQVRGGALFEGYLTEEGLCHPFTGEGWFCTQDLGKWDESGRLIYLGRRDLLFRCGGEFVSPEEIEREILHVDCVEQVVVVPVEDPEFGKCPVAVIRVFDQDTVDFSTAVSRIEKHLEDRLPTYKRPRKYLPWPNSLLDSFKVNRKVIAAFIKQNLSEYFK